MVKISYIKALKNPLNRQRYLDWLVESSGLNFPYVSEFKYITNEEAIKMKNRIFLFSEKSENELEEELKGLSATCTPDGPLPTNSTIYFTENNFSDNCRELINKIVSSQDFEIAQRTELCYHEAVHSEHFGKGIDGFNLGEFELETEKGKALFLIASEIDAHAKHIQELGKTKTNSFYLKEYQKFLVKGFTGHMRLLPLLAKSGFKEKLARKIFDKYNNLKYNKL